MISRLRCLLASLALAMTAFAPMASTALAQTTPNVHLALPPTGTPQWGSLVNNNFTLIDTAIGALRSNFQGAWSSSVSYTQGQIVTYGGGAYVNLVASNFNLVPGVSGSWGVLTSPTAPLTAASVTALITAGQTGCGTAGYAWNPATATCLPYASPASVTAALNAASAAQSTANSALAASGVTSVYGRTGAVIPNATDIATAGTLSNPTTGNAGTATALAATPTQCTGTNISQGVAANGNANCIAAPAGGVTSVYGHTGAVVPNATDLATVGLLSNSTSGNAGTATRLAATPTVCGTGYVAQGVDASGNATGCVAVSSGTGSVTSFTAPTAGFPTWLVPAVTNPTSTPVLSLVPGPIPNAALANSMITINTIPCTLGVNCTIALVPPPLVSFYASAICDGGSGFAAAFTRYDNQQPQTGCDLPASSTSAYMAFQYQPALAQYAALELATPLYWTHTDAYVVFAGTLTSGNVGWVIDTACTNDGQTISTPTFGTAATITTVVSPTGGAKVTTAIFSNVAIPGTNGCTAGTTAPGSVLTVRIHRALTGDTQAGDAHLIGMTLVTGRSQ